MIYGNLTMQSPDGSALFRCGQNKFNWYLRKGLAEKVDDTTARLLFDPAGRGASQHPFLMMDKENCCWVCGAREDQTQITRHHVVPHCYRTHFPAAYKEHNHFDVVPLCRTCHDLYEKEHSKDLRGKLAAEFDAPEQLAECLRRDAQMAVLAEAVQAAWALTDPRNGRIPDWRRAALRAQIETSLGRVTSEEEISALGKRKLPKPEHGCVVVRKLTDIDGFIHRWRRHFVDTMGPRHLPPLWTVEGLPTSVR